MSGMRLRIYGFPIVHATNPKSVYVTLSEQIFQPMGNFRAFPMPSPGALLTCPGTPDSDWVVRRVIIGISSGSLRAAG